MTGRRRLRLHVRPACPGRCGSGPGPTSSARTPSAPPRAAAPRSSGGCPRQAEGEVVLVLDGTAGQAPASERVPRTRSAVWTWSSGRARRRPPSSDPAARGRQPAGTSRPRGALDRQVRPLAQAGVDASSHPVEWGTWRVRPPGDPRRPLLRPPSALLTSNSSATSRSACSLASRGLRSPSAAVDPISE